MGLIKAHSEVRLQRNTDLLPVPVFPPCKQQPPLPTEPHAQPAERDSSQWHQGCRSKWPASYPWQPLFSLAFLAPHNWCKNGPCSSEMVPWHLRCLSFYQPSRCCFLKSTYLRLQWRSFPSTGLCSLPAVWHLQVPLVVYGLDDKWKRSHR